MLTSDPISRSPDPFLTIINTSQEYLEHVESYPTVGEDPFVILGSYHFLQGGGGVSLGGGTQISVVQSKGGPVFFTD